MHCSKKIRAEILNILDDLDTGEMGIYQKVLKRGSRVNYITRLILDSDKSVLGIVAKQGGKMVVRSAQILGDVKVRTMPLYWRKERGHGRLGVMLKLLGNMCRIH